MSALVEITDVCKIYNPGENEVRALNHVSVTIDEGEFVYSRCLCIDWIYSQSQCKNRAGV